MSDRSDINAVQISLIGGLGIVVTVVLALAAAVSYFTVAARVKQSRSDEAAVRIQHEVDQIKSGTPVAEPWLNADLQHATQETQLAGYARRTIDQDDGSQRIVYAIPINQAMESVLKDLPGSHSQGAPPKEVGP